MNTRPLLLALACAALALVQACSSSPETPRFESTVNDQESVNSPLVLGDQSHPDSKYKTLIAGSAGTLEYAAGVDGSSSCAVTYSSNGDSLQTLVVGLSDVNSTPPPAIPWDFINVLGVRSSASAPYPGGAATLICGPHGLVVSFSSTDESFNSSEKTNVSPGEVLSTIGNKNYFIVTSVSPD